MNAVAAGSAPDARQIKRFQSRKPAPGQAAIRHQGKPEPCSSSEQGSVCELLMFPLCSTNKSLWPPSSSSHQVHKDTASKRLHATQKQLQQVQGQAADAVKRAEAAEKEQQRLKGEVQRLTSIVQSHSIRLEK
jgi:hypothetical protein